MKKQALICIKCDFAEFLDPKKDICWKTGGLYCQKLDIMVEKYEECHMKDSTNKEKKSLNPFIIKNSFNSAAVWRRYSRIPAACGGKAH